MEYLLSVVLYMILVWLMGIIVIVNFISCCLKPNHKMLSTLLSSLSGIYLNISEILSY